MLIWGIATAANWCLPTASSFYQAITSPQYFIRRYRTQHIAVMLLECGGCHHCSVPRLSVVPRGDLLNWHLPSHRGRLGAASMTKEI